MAKIALLTLHGVGDHPASYADELRAALMGQLGASWSNVSFQPVHYAPVFRQPQRALWEAILEQQDRGVKLKLLRARPFLLGLVGDALTPGHAANRSPAAQAYIEVQRRVRAALEAALSELNGNTSAPVVVLAQSLGGHLISNYLWDAEHRRHLFEGAPERPTGAEAFYALRTLRALHTTGCNIALYTAGLAERRCFQPIEGMQWRNFVDPTDLLGWPVRPLGPTYEWVQDQAVHVNRRSILGLRAAHKNYWRDAAVLKPLAHQLQALMG